MVSHKSFFLKILKLLNSAFGKRHVKSLMSKRERFVVKKDGCLTWFIKYFFKNANDTYDPHNQPPLPKTVNKMPHFGTIIGHFIVKKNIYINNNINPKGSGYYGL